MKGMHGVSLYIVAGLLILCGVGAIVSLRWSKHPGALLIGLALLVAAEGTFTYQSWWPLLIVGLLSWPLWRLAERP